MVVKTVYIVTGANGFLGNNIVRKLSGKGEIRALVLPKDSVKPLEGLNCTIYRGDVTDKASLEPLFRVDKDTKLYVIHCAGLVYIKSRPNPQVEHVNFDGTKNMAELTLAAGGKLLYVCSVHALPEKPEDQVMGEVSSFDPEKVEGAYAKVKAKSAQYILDMVRNQGLNACILQPSGIIGPNDYGRSHLTMMLLDYALGRLKACVKGGYDFVDVRDVAQGVIAACERGVAGESYILSNRFVSVREMLDVAAEFLGKKRIKLVLPMWMAKAVAPLAEIYYDILKQPPLFTRYSMNVLCSNGFFTNDKAKKVLGYTTRDFRETIRDAVDSLAAQGRIPKKKPKAKPSTL